MTFLELALTDESSDSSLTHHCPPIQEKKICSPNFDGAILNGPIVSNAAGKCAGSSVALQCAAPIWQRWEKFAQAGARLN
jgi:hypothetical protein